MAEESKLANPGPLGLMGFGVTTVLLNLHNAGMYGLGAMILAMGIFYGGFAQIFAGFLEYKKGNTFGVTAFCSFGLFWLSLVFLMVFPKMGWGEAPSTNAMVAYFSIWGLFTFLMFIGTLMINRGLQVVFLSLAILFWLLALSKAGIISEVVVGIEGIFCGLSAMYVSIAGVLNEIYGKPVLPVGPVKKR